MDAYRYEHTIDSADVVDALDAHCDSLDRPTVVLLDNASVHTSAAVRERRAEWEKRGLTLYVLPPYSPQLNPIEILWRKMKYEWMPRWAYDGIDSLREAVSDIMGSTGMRYGIEFVT